MRPLSVPPVSRPELTVWRAPLVSRDPASKARSVPREADHRGGGPAVSLALPGLRPAILGGALRTAQATSKGGGAVLRRSPRPQPKRGILSLYRPRCGLDPRKPQPRAPTGPPPRREQSTLPARGTLRRDTAGGHAGTAAFTRESGPSVAIGVSGPRWSVRSAEPADALDHGP